MTSPTEPGLPPSSLPPSFPPQAPPVPPAPAVPLAPETDHLRWPRLTAQVVAGRHLLLTSADADWDEVETLLLSAVVGARWAHEPVAATGLPGELDLLAEERSAPSGSADPWLLATTPAAVDAADPAHLPTVPRANLTGPWRVDLVARHDLTLPEWAVAAWVVDVDPEREGPAPSLPGGHGRLLDAFGSHHPVGLERQVLEVVTAAARRLGGAVRTSTGVVVEPDPHTAVDLTLHSPTWLEPPALASTLAAALPGLEVMPGVEHDVAAQLDGYGALWTVPGAEVSGADVPGAEVPDVDPVRAGAARTVLVEVEAAEVLPGALAASGWTAEGVISYHLRWLAHPADRDPDSRLGRRHRAKVREAIEAAAGALHDAVGGELVDEDHFLLDRTQLPPPLPLPADPDGYVR